MDVEQNIITAITGCLVFVMGAGLLAWRRISLLPLLEVFLFVMGAGLWVLRRTSLPCIGGGQHAFVVLKHVQWAGRQ